MADQVERVKETTQVSKPIKEAICLTIDDLVVRAVIDFHARELVMDFCIPAGHDSGGFTGRG